MPFPKPITKAQRRELLLLWKRGYTIWPTGVWNIPRHKPLQALCDMGLASFNYGVPRDSWLTTIGYVPLWADPVC